MPKTLIIAEKPSVAADIAKVVGAGKKGKHAWEGETHLVSWAVGHLVQFVPPEAYEDRYRRWRIQDLPILPPEFKISPVKRTKPQLEALKKLIRKKDVDRIVNVCDAGREGELIFREIYRYAGVEKPVDRLWLQSMTKSAIKASLSSPRKHEDVQGLADAADCRAESDWLIGMNATRALTVRLRSRAEKTPWSAGRVQTPTLAMLVKREKEILAHIPEPYWVIQASFAVGDPGAHEYQGVWHDPKAEGRKDRIFDPAERDRIVAALETRPTAKATETRKDRKEAAPPLFDLTSLQREANKRFSMSAKHTLRAAQSLYEAHKLLTYPRTDSRALPEDYGPHVQRVLEQFSPSEAYGEHARRLIDDGLANTKRNFDDSAITDHFAIIPTDTGGATGRLSKDEARIYDLVVKRFLAAFHPSAVWAEVERTTAIGEDLFRTTGRDLKVPGWRAVFPRKKDDTAPLPPLAGGDRGTDAANLDHELEEKETRPPSRLKEGSLLGLMESAGKEVDDEALARVLKDTGGLGTPATRADIIETLLNRDYVSRCKPLEGGSALRATARGILLIDALEGIKLPRLTSPAMTADLEKALSDMENDRRQRLDYMTQIRNWTGEIVERVREFKKSEVFSDHEPLGLCPRCKAPVRQKLRAYQCENGGLDGTCEMVIWKDVRGRFIDPVTASELLAAGETRVKRGFFAQSGREYEAKLVFGPTGRLEVDAAGNANEGDEAEEEGPPVDLGTCPLHPQWRVIITGRKAKCEGHEKGECRLDLPRTLAQRRFTDEEMTAIIGTGSVGPLDGFISKKGRPFSATIKLTAEGRIEWEFPERGSRGQRAAPAGKEFPVNAEPICAIKGKDGAMVIEAPTEFVCTDESVKRRLPREVCSREITRDEAKAYFTDGETPLLSGLVSKKGNEFSAVLYAKKSGKHGFRFEDA